MQTDSHSNAEHFDTLPPASDAFKWPLDAARKMQWCIAAARWAVLRKAYKDHPGAWFQGANAYLEAGDYDKAEALLIQAREKFSKHPDSLTFLAALAIRREDLTTADAFLTQARKHFPNNLQVWLKSAECAEKQGNLPQAIEFYETACACAPSLPVPFIQYAEFHMRHEEWSSALTRWEHLRKAFPENPLGYTRAAEAARMLGLTRKARHILLSRQYGESIFQPDEYSRSTTRSISKQRRLKYILELSLTKALFNLRSEVQRSFLSYSWWMIEPLLHMGVYYLVFSVLLRSGVENFSIFLLTGLIPYMWFMKCVSISSSSIIAGQNLLLQVNVPTIFFPLTSVIQASIKQIPVFLILLLFVWLGGMPVGSHWFALVPVIVVQATLILLVSCTVAAIIPFIRDLSQLVPTGLTFIMFISGIFYDYKNIPAEWQSIFLYNPVAFLLKCYRDIFIEGTIPPLIELTWWFVFTSVGSLILFNIYRKLQPIFPHVIQE